MSAAIRPKKSMEDFTREIRERQEAHYRMLMERKDCLSRSLARYSSKHSRASSGRERRQAEHRRQMAEEVRLAEQRRLALSAVCAEASGELADLIAEQGRDARTYRISRPWEERLDAPIARSGYTLYDVVAA